MPLCHTQNEQTSSLNVPGQFVVRHDVFRGSWDILLCTQILILYTVTKVFHIENTPQIQLNYTPVEATGFGTTHKDEHY